LGVCDGLLLLAVGDACFEVCGYALGFNDDFAGVLG
jgi:hypothetical protein